MDRLVAWASRPLLSMSVVAVLLISGCSTNIVDDVRILRTSSEGLTAGETRLLERHQKYAKWRRNALGAGAAAGCAAGAAASSNNRIVGCLVGALFGGTAGYIGGSYLASLNEQAADSRSSLSGQLSASNVALAETRDAVAISRTMVRSETQNIAQLNKKYKAGSIQKAAYEAQTKTLNTKFHLLEDAIMEAENNVNDMELKAGEQGNPGQLGQKIASMHSELASLRSIRASLVASISTIPDGIDKPSV